MKTAKVCTTILLMLAAPLMAQTAIWLDNVEGLSNGNILIGSGSVTFELGCSNEAPLAIGAVNNGFRVYGSDSSVTWEDGYYGLVPEIESFFGEILFFAPPEFNGVGADTIGFTGYRMFLDGIPVGYDGPFCWITVALSDTASIGGTFCLDSAWFPPTGTWKWSYGAYDVMPSWDGPHCWPVVGSCCVGLRGNINGSPDNQIDISDLVYQVEYMYTDGPVPPCWDEADVNASGGTVHDISDLVRLADYMFYGGPPPDDCP